MEVQFYNQGTYILCDDTKCQTTSDRPKFRRQLNSAKRKVNQSVSRASLGLVAVGFISKNAETYGLGELITGRQEQHCNVGLSVTVKLIDQLGKVFGVYGEEGLIYSIIYVII